MEFINYAQFVIGPAGAGKVNNHLIFINLNK
jgi:hypothetical protein